MKKPKPIKHGPGRPAHVISEEAARSDAARIGARIRRLREAAGLSIAAAAAAIGVPYTRWSDWELGRSTLQITDLRPVLDALGCELGDVIPEGD